MIGIIKRLQSKNRNDNRGSAIVLVIIALAMVVILAMTIMWMSMTNYYTKATDKGNKQGFYSSETVLEQIKSGLEEDASLAASRAYAYILTKDYQSDATADRNYEFKKKFIDYFVDIVCVKSPTENKYKYSLTHLRDFVDVAIQPELTKQTAGSIKYLATIKAGTITDNQGDLLYSYDTDIIKIEGLHLEYTDKDVRNNEFVSIIDTDVVISVPDVSFTQNAVLPDIFAYALVADKKLDLKVNGKTDIDGSIYAGDDGITMSDELKIQKADRVISKGDIIVGNTDVSTTSSPDTKLTITGKDSGSTTEFWANDIRLGNGVSLTTTNVNTYVADDLTLSGRKAKVTMTGNGSYYGYGSSDTNASASSAIVLNGIGSTVDMDDLNRVTLLGRTFVSVPHLTVDPINGTLSNNSIDFVMGESLAVKGEQVAFLVPDYCISYQVNNGTDTVTTKLSNPFITYADYSESNLKVNLSDFSEYVEPNGYKTIFPNGVGGLAYVYMVMSGDKANQYYEAYYKNNLSKLDNYFAVYTGAGKVEMPPEGKTEAEANFITALGGYYNSNPDKVIENDGSQLNTANPVSNKADITSECESTKKNLCAKLVPEISDATLLANTLYDNLIRHSDVDDLISYNGSDSVSFEKVNGTHTYKALFVKPSSGKYTYTDTDIRVLVVDGDVDVKADFTGLMIASGTVTIDQGVKIRSIINSTDDDIQALKDVLQLKKSVSVMTPEGLVTEDRSALQYFVDGSGYNLDGLQTDSSDTLPAKVDFTKLVNFNNWIKK